MSTPCKNQEKPDPLLQPVWAVWDGILHNLKLHLWGFETSMQLTTPEKLAAWEGSDGRETVRDIDFGMLDHAPGWQGSLSGGEWGEGT